MVTISFNGLKNHRVQLWFVVILQQIQCVTNVFDSVWKPKYCCTTLAHY
jgi:hypothetical protein